MDNLDKLIQDRIDDLHRNSRDPFPGRVITIANHDCRSVWKGAPTAWQVQLDADNKYPVSITTLYGGWM